MQSAYYQSGQELEAPSKGSAPTLNPITKIALFPTKSIHVSSVALKRQLRSVLVYTVAYLTGLSFIALGGDHVSDAIGLGLIIPGAGFVFTSALWMFVVTIGLFITALFLWFATGNAIGPILVWFGSLIGAAAVAPWSEPTLSIGTPTPVTTLLILLPPVFGLGALGVRTYYAIVGRSRRLRLNEQINREKNLPFTYQNEHRKGELSLEDLKRINLLLDRALQPIEAFEGFEWIDQYQTSAVRYQLSFISYALSVVQAEYLPAFKGYFHEAQDNLALKQQDWRVWRYWREESAWGNLKLTSDPIARDNIMYSGFVAAQLAFRINSMGYDAPTATDGLSCVTPSGKRNDYSLAQMKAVLARQYEQSNLGLLPCEPNWVYPLCNSITAAAIKTHDTISGENTWGDLARGFRDSLEREFLNDDGKFVPFRSSYTGFAAPSIGGAVMQAFPCLFLNTIFPDIARRQWFALLEDKKTKKWRRLLWPIDVGNYGFSRASSYAASAAAAREMGDHATTDQLLTLLDQDCPPVEADGAIHRPDASLWAHANEVIGRTAHAGSFQKLATKPNCKSGPYLETAAYEDILVAECKNEKSGLRIVAYPRENAGIKSVTLAGLRPGQRYELRSNQSYEFTPDSEGEARLHIPFRGRTMIEISMRDGR